MGLRTLLRRPTRHYTQVRAIHTFSRHSTQELIAIFFHFIRTNRHYLIETASALATRQRVAEANPPVRRVESPTGRLAEHARLSVSRAQRPPRWHGQHAVRRDKSDGAHGDVAKRKLYRTECNAASTTQKVPWQLHGAPSGSSSHERRVCEDNTQPRLVRHQDMRVSHPCCLWTPPGSFRAVQMQLAATTAVPASPSRSATILIPLRAASVSCRPDAATRRPVEKVDATRSMTRTYRARRSPSRRGSTSCTGPSARRACVAALRDAPAAEHDVGHDGRVCAGAAPLPSTPDSSPQPGKVRLAAVSYGYLLPPHVFS